MAKYEVKVVNPSAGDVDLEVFGVGVFKNGSSRTVELSTEQAKELGESPYITVKKKEGGDK
jgi:hypothetical protein